MPRITSRTLLRSFAGSPRRPGRCVAAFLALTIAALTLAVGDARPKQGSSGVRPQAPPDTAARVERVLKGLRPRMEAEGAPARWTLAERMAAHKVPGVSLAIIDGGRVVWAQGFGVKEVGGQNPVSATTLFQAASNSKPVTVSAMLRLVDKGTLSLDANVNQYLTSWKLPENEFTKEIPVTLRRLATHTGGTTVHGFRGYKVGVPRPTVPELLDGKAPANHDPVRVDTIPGQKFRYSGGGTIVIQQLLADAAGTPFPALLQQQVFGPLGMGNSTFEQPLPEGRAADAARGHEKNAVLPGGWHVYPELAAAGLWTTPTDLATWAVAMGDAVVGRSTTFLSRATAAQIIGSAVPGRSPRERVGLGLLLYDSGDNLSLGHGGSNEGFLSDFKMFPNTGKGFAVMLNTGESGVGLMREIQFAIADEYKWPEIGTTRITTVAVDPAALDGVAGIYAIELTAGPNAGRNLCPVVREGTRLFIQLLWANAREELYPQSPTTFIGANGGRFSFTKDAAGRDVMMIGEGPRAMIGVKQVRVDQPK